MDPFRVRLTCIDHYQATASELDPPLPLRDGASAKDWRPRVPVIRVFGATETGQKVCVHVHGAFPYLYIEYNGPLDSKAVNSAISNLHLSVDHALAVSYRRNTYDRKTAYVAHITLVKGIPFYGYHVGYRFFFKIYLLNPFYITRLADLLHQGAVMKRPLQPYESHMQYIPQWMCDYNLYGCSYMDCRQVKFRAPVPDYLELNNLDHRWHDRSIDPKNVTVDPALGKQSHCFLEVDVCVQDILNRESIQERPLHHDFSEFLRPATFNERLVPSVAGLWQDETKRRKKRMGLKDPDSTPFGPEELISMSADPRNQARGGWIHEDEFHELAYKIAANERHNDGNKDTSFATFLNPSPYEPNIKTALNSVVDLFPEELDRCTQEKQHAEPEPPTEVLVDENSSLSYQPNIHDSVENVTHDPSSEEVAKKPTRLVSFGVDDSFYDGIFDDITYREASPENDNSSKEHNQVTQLNQCDNHQSNMDDKLAQAELALSEDDVTTSTLERQINDSPKKNRSIPKKPRFWSTYDPAKYEIPKYSPSKEPLPRQETNEKDVTKGNQGRFFEPPSSETRSSLSQKSVRTKLSNSRLNFPVVKDPHDPLTIMRFSQDGSQSSNKDSGSLHDLQMSLPSGSIARASGNGAIVSSSPVRSSSTVIVPPLDSHVAEMKENISSFFNFSTHSSLHLFRFASPSTNEVIATLQDHGRPSMVYQNAYYSEEFDVPERPREYAGREFRLESDTIHYLPAFDTSASLPAMFGEQYPIGFDRLRQDKIDKEMRESCTLRHWEFAAVPPSRSEVIEWFENLEQPQESAPTVPDPKLEAPREAMSQIEGPTQNPHGFKYSQKAKATSVEHQTQYMSIMSIEVHVNTRDNLSANPAEDEITCIFWCIQSEDEDIDVNSHLSGVHVGMLYHGEGERPEDKISKALKIDTEHEPTELDLINRLVDIVRYYDPDVITGYEVHNGSWGYVIERARKKYDFDIADEISRVKAQSHGKFGKDEDRWGSDHTSSIQITGRHMINIWRAMQSELNLLQYTMENVVFHLLHRRIPHYSHKDLTKWHQSGTPRNMTKLVEYYSSRVQMNLEIIEANEIIPRTSEQARLLGIDFASVYYRGSQFKVESLMFRIAKPENFLLVSPSRRQVGQQNALECLPLVMEPQSDFYTSPLIVLDFQSLYPSVMIAYNYCYSTFLGRAAGWRGRDKMGFLEYERQPRLLELLKDKINIAPNGMMYAKQEVRQSLLAKMLTEILETRVMVKGGMKADKDDKLLQRLLNNRQLALKLIANVTYGYTSASFSGRMPCSEIADSIVQSGRETLEKAISLIHSIDRWGAEVVYGDTDSLFVYLKGRTRDQAFDIGEEIAQAVTEINPRPIKLKFEKVYHPCVLLAKKRYVGFKYEHRTQTEPEFDAKGIETVRRDGTPAEQKIEEKALKLLFRTSDLSQVKSYFQRQCNKIMLGRVSIQDFCFAREVRLGTYSERGTMPAGAMISTKRMLDDPRLEPQYGERVPYVVITGAPGSRLIDRCVAPDTLLQDAQLDLDAEYYITKNIIPPLERIFNLVGANVRQWFDEMPKVRRIRQVNTSSTARRGQLGLLKKTLESYMRSSSCAVCRGKLSDPTATICTQCLAIPHLTLLDVVSRLRRAEKRVVDLETVCRSCMGVSANDEISCDSMDCPVFYSRTRDVASLQHSRDVLEPVVELLEKRGDDELDW